MVMLNAVRFGDRHYMNQRQEVKQKGRHKGGGVAHIHVLILATEFL